MIEEETILPITEIKDEPVVYLNNEVTTFFPNVPEPVSLVTKYTVKISELDKELAELSVKMLEINNRKTIYEEVLNDLLHRGE